MEYTYSSYEVPKDEIGGSLLDFEPLECISMTKKKSLMLFDRTNFILVLIGIGIMVVGYLLMMGGGATSPDVYPEATLYGAQRTIVAPILVLIGLLVEGYAIMRRPKLDPAYYEEELTEEVDI